jgi:hypothetical protein
MARSQKPFTLAKRADSKSFVFSLSPACGLAPRICARWQRKSFQNLPPALAAFRTPRTKTSAGIAVQALIDYLKKHADTPRDKVTCGTWISRFLTDAGNPRAARLMDMLEAKGVVGGPKGSKPRDILITMDELDEMYG